MDRKLCNSRGIYVTCPIRKLILWILRNRLERGLQGINKTKEFFSRQTRRWPHFCTKMSSTNTQEKRQQNFYLLTLKKLMVAYHFGKYLKYNCTWNVIIIIKVLYYRNSCRINVGNNLSDCLKLSSLVKAFCKVNVSHQLKKKYILISSSEISLSVYEEV